MPKTKLSFQNKKIIEKIAAKEGLFPKQVENVILTQFQYIQKHMPDDCANQFNLPYIGKIRVTDKIFNRRKKHLEEKYGST